MMTAEPVERVCPRCGYSLAGLGIGPCPECGCATDPLNPGLPPGSLRWLSLAKIAPPRVVNVLCAVMLAVFFLLLSSPNGYCSDVWAAFAVLVAFGTALVWAAFFAIHLIGRAMLTVLRVRRPRWRWGWIVVPVALVACLSVQRFGWAWQARWWVSRSGFAALVAQGPSRPGLVGGFYVTRAERRLDGTVWCTLGFPDVYSDGPARLVYSPGRDPGGAPVTTDVGAGWWLLIDPT